MQTAARFLVFFVIVSATWAAQDTSKGVLLLQGGSPVVPEVAKRFVELAGGQNAHIVVIPTAVNKELLTPDDIQKLAANFKKLFGVEELVMLHTRDRKVADSEEFVAPLRKATGIWLPGGKTDLLLEPYLGTRTQRELEALLQRGGVVGGSSAGAMVMGSLMLQDTLAASSSGKSVVSEDGRGFGFLTNATIGAHVIQDDSKDQLVAFVAAHPGVLALAPDVTAALVVKGNKAEVIGRSVVIVVDGKKHDGEAYLTLIPGDHYDLKTRIANLLPPETRRSVQNAASMLRRGPAVSGQLEGDWKADTQQPDRGTIHYTFHFKNQPDGTVAATLELGDGKSSRKFTLSEVKQEGLHLEFFLWGYMPDPETGTRKPFFQGTISQDGLEIAGHLVPGPRNLTFKKATAASAVTKK